MPQQSLIVKKDRSSNIELYRIVLMLAIIAHHYVVNSGLFNILEQSDITGKSILFLIWGMWGKTGINCFVLITGYFMCRSQVTAYKFFKLLLEVIFYKISIYLLFVIFGVSDFNILSFYKVLLPFSNVGDGFVTAFLFFYLFIPFLNLLIKNLGKYRHLQLIMLSLFVYTIWDMVPSITVTFNYVSWFMILYLISSYIRIYPNKRYDNNISFWGIVTLACILLAIFSVFIVAYLEIGYTYRYISDSNTLLALAIGVSSFMFFKNLNIKHNKYINKIASSIFGVLLIHSNSDVMREWLWKDVLNNVYFYFTPYCFIHALISVLLVFIICALIDLFRQSFIEKPFLNSLIFSKIIDRVEQINNKYGG